jgi:hypothetical protein
LQNVLNRLLSKKNWPVLIGAVIALAYFGYFVLPGLHGRFNDDDPYNIYYFWSRGGSALVRGLIFFFSTYYRPMGGVYFFSLYEIFGLNPLPYHIAITILLLLNMVLVYLSSVLLTNSRSIGWLCAILMAYHGGMAALVYLPAFIFDVLCFTFFISALYFYLRVRSTGARLKLWHIFVFLLLYIGALDSKEMAVTLPIMVLAYEMFWHWRGGEWKKILLWIRHEAWPGLFAGFVTAIFIVGKSSGPDALSKQPEYHPVFTFKRFFESNVRFCEDLAYLGHPSWFNKTWLMCIWGVLAYLAWRRKENHLKWAVLFIVIAPLPIAFIPNRGDAMLYIPCLGWALILATLISAACDILAREPLLKRLNPDLARGLSLLLAVGLIWSTTDSRNKYIAQNYEKRGQLMWSVKNKLEAILPRAQPGSRIAFYNDIFEGWDSHFIAELLYHDRSVTTRLNTKTPLTVSQLSEMDYVFAYDKGGNPALLKRPGEPFIPIREFIKRPDVRIEANATQIRAGKDSLVLRTIHLNARAIDILYKLNDREMPPVVKWELEGDHTTPLLVSTTNQKGQYHIYAIRDSYGENPNQWISVDLLIQVK